MQRWIFPLVIDPARPNSSFILASEHTRRRDPMDNFKRYGGGWSICNNHYWAVCFSALSFSYLSMFFFSFVNLAIYQIYLCKFLLNVSYAVCWIYCRYFVCYQCIVVCELWFDLNLYMFAAAAAKVTLFSNSLSTLGHATCDLHVCYNVSKLTPELWQFSSILTTIYFVSEYFLMVLDWCLLP